MRLASYSLKGKASYGLLVDGGIVDLPRHGLGAFLALKAALEADELKSLPPEVHTLAPDVRLDEVTLLPPIPDPDKILCVGVNYVAHRQETGRAESAYPTIFTRFANTQVGHGGALVLPSASSQLDFEGELAVVVGKRGRHIPKERALEHVAGYACYQDATVRDWQRHTSQFTPGKNFVATGGFGPWLVTADALPDPSRLTLSTRLNGEQMQHTTTDLMIFDVPSLLAYISTFTELVPGDVVVTGTPGGVGHTRKPPVFMKAGDVVEVEVSGVGTLRNGVVAEVR